MTAILERPPAAAQDRRNGHALEMRKAVVPRSERTRKRLAMCISLAAGYLDGYGLLVLGTYVSFMSGNTTMTGPRTGQANLSLVVSPAIAVVCFLAGSFVGSVVAHSGLRYARRVLFGVVAALLVIVMQLQNDDIFKTLNIAALAFGMGMVNPALSRIGSEAVSLTFVTGKQARPKRLLPEQSRGTRQTGQRLWGGTTSPASRCVMAASSRRRVRSAAASDRQAQVVFRRGACSTPRTGA